MKLLRAEVLDVRRVSSTLWIAEFLIREDIDVKPFMFAMLWIKGFDEIPLSIAWVEDKRIAFVFRVRGEGTKALSSLGKGESILIKAPLGKGFAPPPGRSVLLVAGGVGIAPAPLLASYCKSRGIPLTIVWGVKSRDEVCDPSYIHLDRAIVEIATEDGSLGFRGTALELASILLKKKRFDYVVAVGPRAMLLSFCETFSRIGVETMVSLETMVKCGMGMCGSCLVKPLPKLLCIDGPVFKCSEVMPHLRSSF